MMKNYLRNSISHEKISGLSIISTEKPMSDTINYDNIINYFAVEKSGKKLF